MLLPRPRVKPATRIAFIKKYLASGLTQREFCQQEKLAYPTFLTWLRKYCAASSQAPNFSPAAPSFVPLQLEPSACLHFNHGRQAAAGGALRLSERYFQTLARLSDQQDR